MKNLLAEVYTGLKSLFTGMRITMGQFVKPDVTVQYPHESLKMPAKFRGHIELVRDAETGKAICYACKLCERACPSDCITVEGVKLEGAKKKSVNLYKLDFTKCSLCGACVEACRDNCIEFSREYNHVTLNKDELIMDLFKKLEDESRAKGYNLDVPAPAGATPAAGATTPAAPANPISEPAGLAGTQRAGSLPNQGTTPTPNQGKPAEEPVKVKAE